jgi:hypothetical protein
MFAWLGEDRFVGYRSAARIWSLDGCTSEVIEFVGVGARPSRQEGILLHPKASIPKAHRTSREGIPVTSATRTLLDLGAVVSPDALAIALESAIRLGLTSHDYLQRQLNAHREASEKGSVEQFVEVVSVRERLTRSLG